MCVSPPMGIVHPSPSGLINSVDDFETLFFQTLFDPVAFGGAVAGRDSLGFIGRLKGERILENGGCILLRDPPE